MKNPASGIKDKNIKQPKADKITETAHYSPIATPTSNPAVKSERHSYTPAMFITIIDDKIGKTLQTRFRI